MSDLVQRLRGMTVDDFSLRAADEAADRIESLESACRMALEALNGQHPLSVGKDVAITALRNVLGEKK